MSKKETKLVGQKTKKDCPKSYQTSNGQLVRTDVAAKRTKQGEVFTVNGAKTQAVDGPNGLYLRSKADGKKGNNLGELPEV